MPTCMTCGSVEPQGKRFCGECGARLEAPAVDAGRERKVVTVLFCDLVAFTAASDGADPEEIQARLSPYHARCRNAIERFGGTVEKFIGDAVMAAFGAPTVHEDDPERAVRAGLALLDAVEELNADRGLGLSVRIGVATGEAVVSLGALPAQGEGMLAGDVVNTAARLQTAAPVGRILVGQDTYVATRASIEFEPHDPVVAKGKAEPLPVWVAVASRGSVGEDLTDTSRPMIGREDELAQLQRSFTRAVRESSVQLVTIVAEPGLGKSRLVQAFFAWIDAREELVIWRQGKCPPYGDAVAYAALADIVKAQTGILDSDPPDEATTKLEDTVHALVAGTDLGDQASWLSARLSPLVGVPASEASLEELFTAWRRFLEALAASGPLILVIEDLHWADPALLEFLTHLLEWAVGVPLMLVATARPELYDQAPTWAAGHRNANTLTLIPLDATETAQLVASLLGTRVLPAELHAALLSRAAGNPLYAREYLTILTDRPQEDLSQIVVTEMVETLPGSVQAVIAARLDTLPTESKHLLQAAAVIGHTFWSGAVAAVTRVDENDVRSRLHDLVRRDYLRPSRTSRIAGQDEYTFGHALIADVAYGQLPRQHRASHHQGVADWHAARIPDPDASAESAVVAYHYTQAHEVAQASDVDPATTSSLALAAARWHTHAAEGARFTDTDSALTHAATAVELTSAGGAERPSRLILLGIIQTDAGQDKGAEDTFQEAQRLAEQRGDQAHAAHAQIRRGSLLGHRGLTTEASQLLDAAIQTLEALPAGPELVFAYVSRASIRLSQGFAREAVATAELAMDVIDAETATPLARWSVLSTRGAARVWSGDPQGQEDLEQALAIADEHSLTSCAMSSNDDLSSWHLLARSAVDALGYEDAAHRTAALVGQHADHLWIAGNLAELMVIVGRVAEAAAICEQAATNDHDVEQVRSWMVLKVFWAWSLLVAGEPERAHELLTDAVEHSRTAESDLRGCCLLVAAEWDDAYGEPGAAAHSLDDLTEFLESPDTHEVLAQYLSRLARVLAGRSELDLLEQVIGNAPDGMVFYDNNLLSARAALAHARGEHAAALDLHDLAAAGWESYGYPLEQAHALIGAAQCAAALGQPARAQLEEARVILQRIGAASLLADTERLLAHLDHGGR